MTCTTLTGFFWLCAVQLLIQNVFAGMVAVSVKLKNFENPGGQGDNGHCCDGKWGICINSCDHEFTICFDSGPINRNVQNCKFGSFYSGAISEQNDIVFTHSIGRLPNPLNFTVDSSNLNNVNMKVEIWDDDPLINNDDFVDFLSGTLNLTKPGSGEVRPYTLKTNTKLTAEVSVSCANFFYGPDCEVYCKSHEDAGGHFACEPQTGRKVCKHGWTGVNCNTKTARGHTGLPSTNTHRV